MTTRLDSLPHCRVLLVEDSPADVRLIQRDLSAGSILDPTLEVAGTLAEALAHLDNATFDLLLVDLGLPDASGLHVVRRILQQTAETPLVVITGDGEPGLGVEAVRVGAQDFISKRDLGGAVAARAVRYAVERSATERALRAAQKRESLGLMASGVAHDFNNLLSVILGHATVGQMRIEERRTVESSLRQIVEAAERAAELAQQMLAYSGCTQLMRSRTGVNDLLREYEGLLRASIPSSSRLRFELGDDLAAVLVDRTQIQQVVMNLVLNASQALDGSCGDITVRTDMVVDPQPPQDVRDPRVLVPGEYVRIRIDDTGPGMAEATSSRIFEPFFSTKGLGRGMGLSAVHGIVRGHGGAIEVWSRLGEGTTFSVVLPTADTVEYPQRFILVAGLTRSRFRRLSKGLGAFDLRARFVPDLVEATQVVEQQAEYIAAAILDLTESGSPGQALLDELRAAGGRIPILALTESNGRSEVHSSDAEARTRWLPATTAPEALCAMLAGTLGD